MTTLEIAEPLAMKDLAAFTSLAHRLDPEGAMRVQVASTVLALTVAPLYPHGIGDSTPLVLAMRTVRLSGPEMDGLDEVVPLTNLKDRFARDTDGTVLPLPPNSVLVSWSGIAPPRGRWSHLDTVSGADLARAAEAGISAVSEGTPSTAGSHAVSALRARVWSTPLTARGGAELPSGMAFAAAGLRFIPGSAADPSEEYQLMSSPGWLRLVTPGGHLLTRSAR